MGAFQSLLVISNCCELTVTELGRQAKVKTIPSSSKSKKIQYLHQWCIFLGNF